MIQLMKTLEQIEKLSASIAQGVKSKLGSVLSWAMHRGEPDINRRDLQWGAPLDVEVSTVAKVASSTFLHSMEHKHKVHHGHSLQVLKDTLDNRRNVIIVSGIRNPLHRNLSYFFQTYADDKFNKVRCRANGYRGEYCYLMEKGDIIHKTPDEIIELFFAQSWHFTFTDWLEEFLEITRIEQVPFDKEAGYKIYDLRHGHRLLFYTFEKLPQNSDFFASLFGVAALAHTNNPEERIYNQLYKKTKALISFPDEYKRKLLDTGVMRYFYSPHDIERFHTAGR